MPYATHFTGDCAKADHEPFGRRGRVIVGDLLEVWYMPGQRHFEYLIDGNEGHKTPIGTFEREVHSATFRRNTLLIATKEYVETLRHNREAGAI